MTEVSQSEREELKELTELLAVVCVAWLSITGLIWLYWATGGTVGTWTLWGGQSALAEPREPWISSLLWSIALASFALAIVAWTVARRWSFVPRRVLALSAFVIGLTLLPTVVVETGLQVLMVVGSFEIGVTDSAVRTWRLLFWNPWWVLGVLTFCATAWLDRHVRVRSAGTDETDK